MFNKKSKKNHKSLNFLECAGLYAITIWGLDIIHNIKRAHDRRKFRKAEKAMEELNSHIQTEVRNEVKKLEERLEKKQKSFNPDERAQLSSTLK